MKAPVFIGGPMKSGTTLMRKLISNHSNIFGGLETNWFTEEFNLQWKNGNVANKLKSFYLLTDSEYYSIAKNQKNSYDFLNAFMNYCTQRQGKNRWVEKSPNNIFHTDQIFEYWPNAMFIQLFRNPKDIYASWKKNRKLNLDAFIETIKRIIEVNEMLDAKGLKSNVITVKYSTLVSDTESTLKLVLSHIGEDWEKGIEQNMPDQQEFKIVKKVTGVASATLQASSLPIFRHSLGQWENILTKEEIKRIDMELEKYTYFSI